MYVCVPQILKSAFHAQSCFANEISKVALDHIHDPIMSFWEIFQDLDEHFKRNILTELESTYGGSFEFETFIYLVQWMESQHWYDSCFPYMNNFILRIHDGCSVNVYILGLRSLKPVDVRIIKRVLVVLTR